MKIPTSSANMLTFEFIYIYKKLKFFKKFP